MLLTDGGGRARGRGVRPSWRLARPQGSSSSPCALRKRGGRFTSAQSLHQASVGSKVGSGPPLRPTGAL